MKTPPVPFDSDALRANIASTAQDVVIPDRYQPLVDAVEGLYGVRASLVETMGEYSSRLSQRRRPDRRLSDDAPVQLEPLRGLRRTRGAVRLFAELVVGLLESPLSADQFSLALRELLMWCAAALDGPYGAAYDDALAQVAGSLAGLLDRRPAAFLERDSLLRDLVARVAARPAPAAPFCELYREVLLVGYRRVAERLDVPGWAGDQGAGLTDAAAVAARFDFLAVARAGALADGVRRAPAGELLGPAWPLFSDILGRALDQLTHLDDLEDRFAVCLFFLKDDTLGYRQKEAVVELLGVVGQLMEPARHLDVEGILSRLTAFFRGRDHQFLLMRFKCYEAIGVAIGEAADAKAVDHLIDDVLSWRFQYPDISGATDDWGTIVNPYHLPKIRCWMHIIESNPALYERLAAALNVQLRLGGVYIADTDLFQRDVTRFLNADIRPIYFVAKQLLRTLPVYFSEVGAEGELRTVSTDGDEICGRHDSLVHFLRKQLHAESSNRLVAFSRAVLHYWATLDPVVLEPYVSANTLAAVRLEGEWAWGPHEMLLALSGRHDGGPPAGDQLEAFLDGLIALSPEALGERLAALRPGAALGDEGRRIALMVRTHQLLAHKYSLSADDVGHAVGRHLVLELKGAPPLRGRARRLAARPGRRHARRPARRGPHRARRAGKAIVLSPLVSVSTENIYQKRHIAAGIPSIYGN